jgi:acyl-CoA synthetase (AMP-forming)/AMP-acid ligase II
MDANTYRSLVERVCDQVDVQCILAEPALVGLAAGFPVSVLPFDAVQATPITGSGGQGFGFVQFTSGSTGSPRGIALSEAAVLANLEALTQRLGPEPGDGSCSWLPLSHDMGFVGMLLGSLRCALATKGGQLVLIDPRAFLRRPELWLEACEEFASTITACPNFGLARAARRLSRSGLTDLSSLRVCIVGAEVIDPLTLEEFATATADLGFNPTALCPAYGLAEATLAVSLVAPEDHWTRSSPSVGSDVSAVSCGHPVDGLEVRIANEEQSGIGQVMVRGTSMFDGYTDGSDPRGTDGFFPTGDLGLLTASGELVVMGRADDVIVTAGRKIFPEDIEHAVASAGLARPGCVAVVAHRSGYAVVLEASTEPGPEHVSRDVHRVAVRSSGLAPIEVKVMPRGMLPRTTSGKPRRRTIRDSLVAD